MICIYRKYSEYRKLCEYRESFESRGYGKTNGSNMFGNSKSLIYRLKFIIICMSFAFVLYGCSNQTDEAGLKDDKQKESAEDGKLSFDDIDYPYYQDLSIIDDNYRTYYEVFLYSFYDSNGDGIGDINGLIEKLDYINDGDPNTDTDLGFNGIWLMPIMPSDTYHKYDVKDYYDIDPEYGTLEDFKHLLEECDERDIKVIIDLVLNHSSNNHPCFQSATNSLGIEPCGQETCNHNELCIDHNPYIDYYNFTEGNPSSGGYYHTGVGDWYFQSAFTSNMPDLNLSNPYLRREIEDIMDFWLDMGVGGFRLDAALHYEDQNTEENVEVLSWIKDFVKSKDEDNYIVAEVWTNFSNFVRYYESGIDSVFNFAFSAESGKIVKTLNGMGSSNSGQSYGKAMKEVQDGIGKYSETGIDAPFFTNHDTARSAGFFTGNTDKIKMAGALNIMMSGNVVVYYGEELGMSGSGRDENKRAPMYWTGSNTQDAVGMTNGPADMEDVVHGYGSLEEQIDDPLSIYNYYKHAVRLRNENPEIARGNIQIIDSIQDEDICAIQKTYEDSSVVVLYNISEEIKEVTVSKTDYDFQGIRGYITVDETTVTLEGEIVSLPPYSIVILK